MRVLITGAGGFVGGHLARHLAAADPDAEIHGALYRSTERTPSTLASRNVIDLTHSPTVTQMLDRVRPDVIYHLAAQAFVPRSFEDPWETLQNNILCQLNIIQACLKLKMQPRLLVVSSAEIYGAVRPEELPLTENAPLRPANPYSVSKVAQDMLALQYHISHNLPIMRARPFNHIGPGQDLRFAAPSFAAQIARIELGVQEPVIRVGNLEARRDFTDVRDIVRAYYMIVEKGLPGDVYNVASGQVFSIQQLLDTLLSFTDQPIQVEVDPDRLRPVDVPVIQGDASHLHTVTGWQPEYSFQQTLLDILNDCRQRIQHSISSQE